MNSKDLTGIKETKNTAQDQEKTISPAITLLSMLGIMAVLFLIMFFFPKDGLLIGETKLEFPSAGDFFVYHKKSKDTLSEEDRALKRMIDSTAIIFKNDSILDKKKRDSIYKHRLDSVFKIKRDSVSRLRKSIQGNAKAFASLQRFFKSLENAGNKKVRIMHYGDSQIESDRITSYLRNQLQKRFGGSGVGLFPVIQVSPKWTLNNAHSGNWKRYVGFGKKNSAVTHMKYGALMSFCRFTPLQATGESEVVSEAWIRIKKSKLAYRTIRKFALLNIYLRNNGDEVTYDIHVDGVSAKSGTLKPFTEFQRIQVRFPVTPEEIKITFKGKESPDIFGLSLEGNRGVIMDNIPLRGSSGTLFTRQDATLLKKMYQSLSPDLIILEFGGNTVPYIKYKKQIKDYGNWMVQQINYIKRLNPGVPVLMIGPGDMSVREKTEYVTQPMLEPIRDVLKEAALSTDCLFWDMYEAMGGKNSMPKWVNADPALGASDYIHFSPKGAVKIAEIFKKELFRMYDTYEQSNNQVKEIVNDTIR